MLVTTLCGMRAATFAVGLLPTYDRIGVRAPGASGAVRAGALLSALFPGLFRDCSGEAQEGDNEVNG
ncbi:hypothetical protein [Streptomyces violaceusniger]|uniref:hypothetical protein n=1 Tax=Streptomyces violaceusniger TaxID=68280 RepID=UPI0001E4B338|nr:hypothetical protein [Streptomyces violaceusniger]